MAGYFKITLLDPPPPPPAGPSPRAAGSLPKTLKVESIDQYKGNLRVDFTITGVAGGSVNPPYGYVFLDEDEVVNCDILVFGNTGQSGELEAIAYDGEDTDTDSLNVGPFP